MKEKIIQLKSVSLSPDVGKRLIDISFFIYEGETVIFFGIEETGLENLFPMIVGFNDDYDGEIYYRRSLLKTFGHDKKNEFRKSIGYVSNDFGLLNNMSVEMNIALPLEYHSKLSPIEIKSRVDEVINDMNLTHCKKIRPIGLTRSELLRTAYGRAVVMDPEMVLIEHATEGQSHLNLRTIMHSLKMHSQDKEKTTLIVSYTPDKFLDIGDTFIMFFNGRIVFRGTKDDYINSDNSYLNQFKNGSFEGPMPIL